MIDLIQWLFEGQILGEEVLSLKFTSPNWKMSHSEIILVITVAVFASVWSSRNSLFVGNCGRIQ